MRLTDAMMLQNNDAQALYVININVYIITYFYYNFTTVHFK